MSSRLRSMTVHGAVLAAFLLVGLLIGLYVGRTSAAPGTSGAAAAPLLTGPVAAQSTTHHTVAAAKPGRPSATKPGKAHKAHQARTKKAHVNKARVNKARVNKARVNKARVKSAPVDPHAVTVALADGSKVTFDVRVQPASGADPSSFTPAQVGKVIDDAFAAGDKPSSASAANDIIGHVLLDHYGAELASTTVTVTS